MYKDASLGAPFGLFTVISIIPEGVNNSRWLAAARSTIGIIVNLLPTSAAQSRRHLLLPLSLSLSPILILFDDFTRIKKETEGMEEEEERRKGKKRRLKNCQVDNQAEQPCPWSYK